MKIAEIERQIAEYKMKLDQKTKVRGKKGKLVTRSIPGHLKTYIYAEIKKLEKQKLSILNLKRENITVGWENVTFENGQIRIKISSYYSKPFKLEASRKSFELLKPYFVRMDLQPISITLKGTEILSIKNHENIHSVVRILSIQDDINLYLNTDNQTKKLSEIVQKLHFISNKQIFEFFKIKERSKYLEILCGLQNENHKIIPTTDISYNDGRFTFADETFLFTIENELTFYIVWESTSINKATYIFKTDKHDTLIFCR